LERGFRSDQTISHYRVMLTAVLGALADFLRLLVGWLVTTALWPEHPGRVAWPIFLALVLQVIAAGLNVVVWWSRGHAWPINCGYPLTTTGRGACRTRVLGEWRRCHLHRRRWLRRRDDHLIDPNLRRWQTIKDGMVVDRDDLQGSGVVRRLAQLGTVLHHRNPKTSGLVLRPAVSVMVETAIEATRFVLALAAVGLGFVGVAVVLRSAPLKPRGPGRWWSTARCSSCTSRWSSSATGSSGAASPTARSRPRTRTCGAPGPTPATPSRSW